MMLTLLLSFLIIAHPTGSLADRQAQAQLLYEEDRNTEAIAIINDILPEVREGRDSVLLSDCLSTLAISSYRLSRFDDALEAQKECYRIDRALGDNARISSSLNNLAAISFTLGDYETAIPMVLEAVRIEEQAGESATLAVRYGMACDVFQKAGRFEESLEYGRKALAVDQKAGRETQAAKRKSQIATSLMDLGRYKEALQLLEEAYDVFQRTGPPNSLSITCRQLGLVHDALGHDQEAVHYLSRALELSSELGNLNHQRNISRELAGVLVRTQPQKAMEYMERSLSLTDSIFVEKTAAKEAQLRAEYDLVSKEQEITLQRQKLRSRSAIIALMSLLLAVLLTAVFFLSRYNRTLKKNNEMIKDANRLKDRLLASHGDSDEVQNVANELGQLGHNPRLLLTRREQEVATYCAQGLISKEIASKMNISERTVEKHKENIFRKLDINTTVELALLFQNKVR